MGRRAHVTSVLSKLLGPIIGTLLAIPAAVVVVMLLDQLIEDGGLREERARA